MRIAIVVAFDRARAIGVDNALPWHLPDDLARFKALTLGKPVLMGRRTAESLGRALPRRRNLVLNRGGRVPFEGMEAVASVDEALARVDGAEELAVIGGEGVFAAMVGITAAQRVALGVALLRRRAPSPPAHAVPDHHLEP